MFVSIFMYVDRWQTGACIPLMEEKGDVKMDRKGRGGEAKGSVDETPAKMHFPPLGLSS